jgi:hypothetical protein
MKPLSVSEAAAIAGVTTQAVSIALNAKRLTVVEVIGRRAVKQDKKFGAFVKSTRNRERKGNGNKRSSNG